MTIPDGGIAKGSTKSAALLLLHSDEEAMREVALETRT